MPATYDCIATTTLSSAQATVTFSSISGDYTDLLITGQIKGTQNAALLLRVGNGSVDTGSNYSVTTFAARYNQGSVDVASERYSSITSIYASGSTWYSGTNFGTLQMNLANYSNTTTNKTIITRLDAVENANYCGPSAVVGLWRSTSAINIVTFSNNGGNFDVGSTFSLYGIKAA
jgi:hypothetical protein